MVHIVRMHAIASAIAGSLRTSAVPTGSLPLPPPGYPPPRLDAQPSRGGRRRGAWSSCRVTSSAREACRLTQVTPKGCTPRRRPPAGLSEIPIPRRVMGGAHLHLYKPGLSSRFTELGCADSCCFLTCPISQRWRSLAHAWRSRSHAIARPVGHVPISSSSPPPRSPPTANPYHCTWCIVLTGERGPWEPSWLQTRSPELVLRGSLACRCTSSLLQASRWSELSGRRVHRQLERRLKNESFFPAARFTLLIHLRCCARAAERTAGYAAPRKSIYDIIYKDLRYIFPCSSLN